MTRKLQAAHLWTALGAVLAALLVAWIVHRSEWTTIEGPAPLPEALQRDGTHAAQRHLQRLGLDTRRAEDLSVLPPQGATLVISSTYWNLIDGTEARLRDWVLAGGHLVIDGAALQSQPKQPWPGLQWEEPRKGEQRGDNHSCRVLNQRADLAPSWGDERGFVTCTSESYWKLKAEAPVWALDSEAAGLEAARVSHGRGRITAFAPRFDFDWQFHLGETRNFSNRGLIAGDHAALLAALVDARPGSVVWFVPGVERQPLPKWLWQRAAPVLLAAVVALVLALWHFGTRFGPLQAEPPAARRSLSAQIRGTADFLFRHHGSALHAMALRALDDTAMRQLPAWRRLDAAGRAAALARATDLPESALAAALAPAAPGGGRLHHNHTLALLETARRLLLARSAHRTTRTS